MGRQGRELDRAGKISTARDRTLSVSECDQLPDQRPRGAVMVKVSLVHMACHTASDVMVARLMSDVVSSSQRRMSRYKQVVKFEVAWTSSASALQSKICRHSPLGAISASSSETNQCALEKKSGQQAYAPCMICPAFTSSWKTPSSDGNLPAQWLSLCLPRVTRQPTFPQ